MFQQIRLRVETYLEISFTINGIFIKAIFSPKKLVEKFNSKLIRKQKLLNIENNILGHILYTENILGK